MVKAYGSAPDLGDLPRTYGIVDRVVGIAPTPSGNSYWLVTIDGKVYPFGDGRLGRSPTLRRSPAEAGPEAAKAARKQGLGGW